MKLVRISAIWCPACLIMRPRMEQVVNSFPHFEHVEYDYDLDEDIIKKYNISNKLPVFILLDGDKELTRIIGEKTVDEITNILKGCIK